MIIYNVTVNIDHSIHDEWLNWMKTDHIPKVMKTGCFTENKICRILAEEQGGKSYAIQYLCASIREYDLYQNKFSSKLQEEHTKRYQGKFVAFRTILKVVHTEKNESLLDVNPN